MAWSMQSKNYLLNNMIVYKGRRGQHNLLVLYHVQHTYLVVHVHHRSTFIAYHLHNHNVANFSVVALGRDIRSGAH